jgi:adenine deaminase
MSTRTITLTDRPPVRIDDEVWPLVASAQDEDHDGQVRCQANRVSKWFVGVRRHADGRAIVYATYRYTSNWHGARGYSAKHGVLLLVGASTEDVVGAIKSVTADIGGCECNGDDNLRWDTLCDECIADLPAEELS